MNEIYQRAIKLLALREHSRFELKNKLKNKTAASDAELEKVLDQLVEKKYLSDERFAHEYISAKMHIWGASRIKQELKQRKVDLEIIDKKITQLIVTDEAQIACEVLLKKYPNELPTGENGKAKIFRFLMQRGFSSMAIKNAINYYQEK